MALVPATRYPYLSSADSKTASGIWNWAKRLVDLLNGGSSSGSVATIESYGGSTAIADNGPAIQAGLDDLNSKGGGTLVFGVGTYKVARSCRIYPKTLIRGQGRAATIIQGTHIGAVGATLGDTIRSGSIFYTSSPINGSTSMYIHVEDLTLQLTNVGSNGACFYESAGTFVTWDRVGFGGGKYGLIMDQSELCDANACEFGGQLAGGAGAWIVNGASLTPGASPGFSNRLSINRSQFNQGSAVFGILDDGGATHSFIDNNYNGCSNHINVGFAIPLAIIGGEFESASGHCVVIRNSSATSVRGGLYAATAGNSSINGTGSPGSLEVSGLPEFSGGAGTKAITGAANFAVIDLGVVINNTIVAAVKDGIAGYVDIDRNVAAGLSLSGANTQNILVNGVKVLGPQQSAVANGVNAAAAPTQAEFNALVTQFNAALAALRAHGIIHT